MRRIRNCDAVVTTQGSFISELRNYPAGTRGIVCQPPRDLDRTGWGLPGVWIWVRVVADQFTTDGTELAFHPDGVQWRWEGFTKRRTP